MTKLATALALALLIVPATPSLAQHSGGHGGGGFHGGGSPGGGGWHGGGGWNGGGGWHGGGWHGGVFVGGPWWYGPWWGWPYPYAYGYPYSYYYPYAYSYDSPYGYYPPAYDGPSVYIQQQLQPRSEERVQGYWYYCASAKAYYPTVPKCPEAWIKVPPAPR
jgi:hypothetical protein